MLTGTCSVNRTIHRVSLCEHKTVHMTFCPEPVMDIRVIKIPEFFYDESCVSCKVMEQTSFGDKELAEKINTYYYPVKINATDQKPINFLGKIYSSSGTKESNELIQQFLNGNYTMPSIVILDENYMKVTTINGYLLKENLMPLTDYFYNKAYKKHTFQEYLKSYITSVSRQNEQ